MITTNGNFEQAQEAEPKKLGIVTTEKIATEAPEPVTRGSDLGKMITTHDEPRPEAKRGKGKKSE